MTTNSSNNILRSILEKEKLSGNNFLDWHRNLRIVLKNKKKLYVLEEPVPEEAPASSATRAEKDAYKKHVDDALEVSCIMLATMNSELKKQHENMNAFDMIEHLKMLYQEQARHERFEVSKTLFQCRLAEGSPVGPHVLKMIGYVENLERLGFALEQDLAIDLILQSLPESYNQFVMNFIMNDMDKTLPQLSAMLRTAEKNINKGKGKAIMLVNDGKFKKQNKKPNKWIGKGNGKEVAKPKPVTHALKPKGGIAKEGNCFHCGRTGHWKRNCPKYLEDKKNGIESSNSAGIFVIEINLSTSASWVLDTGCGSHICTNVQGLKRSRELAKGEVDQRVGNGAKVAALAVGTYVLTLPSGYINEKRISKLHKCGLLDSLDYESFETCRSCLLGKMTKSPFTGKGERASDLLALIHTDVCGPMTTPARGGFQYFITFTDDYS
ncbi:retrotransposon protein putative Ty1-copia subclass, partial [Trifolium pratense]